MIKLYKFRLSSARIIIFGFAAVILLGTVILSLPISAKSREFTPFGDALFTSVSAVCVTGLVVHDTAAYWSAFGQVVILALIQVGGLGVVTVAVAASLASGKKIGFIQRSAMQDEISAPRLGGIVRLTSFILKITAAAELIGAALLAVVFCREHGLKGIWLSLFHSVSAFCNAGFDLMGTDAAPYASLTAYSSSPLVNIVIMLLIIMGGIGFLVWSDVCVNRHRLRRYSMQSKVALSTTAFLIAAPAVYFFIAEFADLPTGERVLNSLFQSVTPRTAGFNTADLNALDIKGKVITIILMLIGGSPGSTAGGIKTTTVAVLLFSSISVFRRKDDTECFGRRVPDDTVRTAAAVLLMYIMLFLASGLIISAVENLTLTECFFESASALGTVGLSLGITPSLGIVSRAILMVLMFFGRVGGLTLIFAVLSAPNQNLSRKPKGTIVVG